VQLHKQLESTIKDREQLKAFLKAYSNGYKVLKVMAFSEAAKKADSMPAGTVIAVLNPRKMEPKPENPLDSAKARQPAYSVDHENQIINLGYSKDYGVCDGESEHP